MNDEELDREEVLRLLPEIKEIKDRELRSQVVDVFQNHAPDYFWEVSASSSGKYHPRDTVETYGLLIHVKRSFKAYSRIADSYLEMGYIDEQDLDYGKAAILLHDLFKRGLESNVSPHTVDDHDEIAYNYLKSNTDLPDPVLQCILSHNGGWGEGKDPENDLEHLHHIADMVSSGRNIYIEMEKPLPKELLGETIFHDDKQELADFAHELWMHWSKNIAEEEDISEERLERWQRQWTPYEELEEDDQLKDLELVERFW